MKRRRNWWIKRNLKKSKWNIQTGKWYYKKLQGTRLSAFKFIQTLHLTLMNATAFSTICRAHRAFRIAASLSLQLSGGLFWALWRPLLWALACPLKEEARKPFRKEQKSKHRRRISAKDHGGEISRLIQPYCVWGLYLCGRTQFLLLQWWKVLCNMHESIRGGW